LDVGVAAAVSSSAVHSLYNSPIESVEAGRLQLQVSRYPLHST